MPIKTLFHGNTEETKKHIQPTVGLTQQVDLLLIKETLKLKTSVIRKSMRKFGVS